jgi:hypothetical protein
VPTIIVVDNDLDTLLTALYVFLDDHVIGPRRIGRPPWLTDAELLCLAIAQVLLGFPSERHWIRYARKHLRHLFPYLPQQSGYNKRLRAAGPLISQAIQRLASATPTSAPVLRLIDSTPVPCGPPERPRTARTWPANRPGPDTATAPATPATSGVCACTWSPRSRACR